MAEPHSADAQAPLTPVVARPQRVNRAFRRLVYRRISFQRIGVQAGDTRAPAKPCAYRIATLAPADFALALTDNPYLSAEEIAAFKLQDAACLVAWDGPRVIASSWVLRGNTHVDQLGRAVEVADHEHFVCRNHVVPDYRGHKLIGHLLHAHSQSLPADDEMWALVYAWNIASLRSLQTIGWRVSGECATRFIFGVPVADDVSSAELARRATPGASPAHR